jgi:peptidoglycan/LPS O-acetylase OafA/YrhL
VTVAILPRRLTTVTDVIAGPSPLATSRVHAFDGVRTIAVLGVLVQHGFLTNVNIVSSPGPIGVRLFFVLSGFLITGILIAARKEAETAGTSVGQVWRAFLLRRALRIFPLAYLAMIIAWMLGAQAMTEHGLWNCLYLGNINSGLLGQAANDGMPHWWSLAVEEQFYLVWPAAILLAPPRAWQPITVAVLFTAAAARIVHFEIEGLWSAYVLTWCRMDALAFGALLAMRRTRVLDLVLLAGGLMNVGGLIGARESLSHTLRESAFVVGSGALIIAVSSGWLRTVLSCRPMVYLGSISYGVYVWGGMMPTLLLPAVEHVTGLPFLPAQLGVRHFVISSAGTLLLSMMSWRYVERPLNDLKRFVPYAGPSRIVNHLWSALGSRGTGREMPQLPDHQITKSPAGQIVPFSLR